MTHYAGSQSLASYGFGYDSRGNLRTDGEDSYFYDNLNRLSQAFVRDPLDTNASDGLWQVFDHDAFGNRKLLSTQRVTNWTGATPPITPAPSPLLADGRDLRSYTLNASERASMSATNHLPSTAGGVLTGSSYDAQGNLTSLWTKPGTSSTQLTMSYDALGRLTSMGDSKRGVTETYTYDDEGLRIMVEVWQGSLLQSKRYMIYNESRQLVSKYDLVLE